MSTVGTYRRYLHRERMNARYRGDGELEAVWQSKQEAEPGTALPSTFPFLDVLIVGGYETEEDLATADVFELVRITGSVCGTPGLTNSEAAIVLAARDALP